MHNARCFTTLSTPLVRCERARQLYSTHVSEKRLIKNGDDETKNMYALHTHHKRIQNYNFKFNLSLTTL